VPAQKPTTMPRKAKPTANVLHRVFVPDLESYSDLLSKPPYIYMKRPLFQHVACELLIEALKKGHLHIEIILPIETFPESYQRNPAQMALVIRRAGADRLPTTNVAVRVVRVEDLKLSDADCRLLVSQPEPGTRYAMVTTSDKEVEIKAGFLMKTAALFHGKVPGYSVVIKAEDMAESYYRKPHYLAFHVQNHLRKTLNNPTLAVVAHRLDNAVRLSTVPQHPINA
jgi:hypothetical protein